jgi:hypothetical protein
VNLNYYEDIPARNPQFDYSLIAKALCSLLLQPHDHAIVVGIHGQWGTGKTTLLDALRSELKERLLADEAIIVDFNAWKFQDRQALWRALILHLLGELRRRSGDENRIEELQQALYRAFTVEEQGPWRIDWRAIRTETIGILLSIVKLDFVAEAIKGSVGGALGWFSQIFGGSSNDQQSATIDQTRVDRLARALERETGERQVLQVQSIEQFLSEFQKLMAEFTENGRRVFVFIDDLDRCLPESALEIFESIKLFLDAPGCGYTVALDREVIRKGLAAKYAVPGEAALGQVFIDPDEYIEKTISVSFDLPRLANRDIHDLIAAVQLPFPLDNRQKELLIAGLGSNPRRIKRFMNTLMVHVHLATIAKEAGLPIHEWLCTNSQPRQFDVFLKLLIIAYRYSGAFAVAVEDPGLLKRLQRVSNTYRQTVVQNPAQEDGAWQDRKNSLASELSVVATLQNEEAFWRLMGEAPRFTDHFELVLELRASAKWEVASV